MHHKDSSVRWHRNGITWTGLVVILGCLLLLGALIYPAILQIRESARQAQCQDHLHNIVISLQDYDINFETLPPAWCVQTPGGPNWSWKAAVLPFVMSAPHYDFLDVSGERMQSALDEPSRRQVMQDDHYDWMEFCPSESMRQNNGRSLNHGRPFIDSFGMKRFLSSSSYVASNGYRWDDSPKPTGCLGKSSNVSMQEIEDGEANTALVGERAFAIGDVRCHAATQYGVQDGSMELAGPYSLAIGEGGINSTETRKSGVPGCSVGFSSQHPGGSQVALADARVVFLSENVTPSTLERLMNRADGKSVVVP